jgi:hypothetical protein
MHQQRINKFFKEENMNKHGGLQGNNKIRRVPSAPLKRNYVSISIKRQDPWHDSSETDGSIQEPLHRGLKSAVDFLEIDFQSRFCGKIPCQLEAVCGCNEFLKGVLCSVVN